MAKKTNPNAGKPGYDKYGVKLVSQRKKEKQAEKNRKQFIESRDARNKKIKDNATQKAQVEKIKNTMGLSETSPSVPKSSTPKRKKQAVASSITNAKIKKLDTSVKGENIKAKLERELSESDQQKLAKLQKMKKRADKKQNRKDKSTERLAFRMGEKATFQDAAALKQKRSEARKQYLRNFASQLARGEQAAPRVGFGEGEDNPNNDTSLTGNSGTQKEVKAKKEQINQDKKDIFANVNTDIVPNQNLGNDFTIDYDRGNSGLRQADELPVTYMQKEYRKKRGY